MTPSDVIAIVAVVVSAVVSILSVYISYKNNKANIGAKRSEMIFERQIRILQELCPSYGKREGIYFQE